MKKIKKEMEFDDSPSGYVTLYNYKEPFMPFKNGFGYEGVLLFDGETDKVQCHFCGEWFDYLPSHIGVHDLHAAEYKDLVGLRQSSSLISESHREKLIASGKERFKNLRKGKKHTKETKEKISKTSKLNANKRETQNERGTCPYQLLDRLQKLAEEFGRTPTQEEAIDTTTYIRVFGSWKNAIELAGLRPRKPGQVVTKHTNNYNKPILKKILKNFIKINHRAPTASDFRRRIIPSHDTFRRHFGSFAKALEESK